MSYDGENSMTLGNEDYFSGVCPHCKTDWDDCTCNMPECPVCGLFEKDCSCPECDSCGERIAERHYSVSRELSIVVPEFYFSGPGYVTRDICQGCQVDYSGRDLWARRQA